MGYSLNQMTMLGDVMVGIVIDDAIVVLENIYRLLRKREWTRSARLSRVRVDRPRVLGTLYLFGRVQPVGL